jgi:single-strand DNA-binding protein
MFKTELMGFIGNDAVTRILNGGNTVTEFSLAWNPNPKDKEAKPIWVKCCLWGDRGSKVEQYLTKGSAVLVYGRLQAPTIYQDRQAVSQVNLAIDVSEWHFCPQSKERQPIAEQMAQTAKTTQSQLTNTIDDELPF